MEPPMFSDPDLIAGGGAIALALALVWKVRRATKARVPTRARRRDTTGDAGTPADHGHGAVWATFGGLGALLSGGDGDGDGGGGDGGGD